MDNLNISTQPAAPTLKTGDWFITLLIMAIPIVGIIMLFVWAFGGGTNPNKANFAKAVLIWTLVLIVVGILWSVIFGMAFMNAMQ